MNFKKECKDCKLKSENKNNLRNHVCNTQKKLKSITDHEAHRQSNDNKENAKVKVDDEIKALIAKEEEKDKETENLIVINTDEEKKLNNNTIPEKC